jgi:beta-lactamase regulating signal transducer with metallopeptidase domain
VNPLLRWLTSPEWAHVVAALLHSIWQGAIVALALAVLMRRLTNPLTRYRCALSALGVIGIAGIVTWAVLNAPNSAPQPTAATTIEPTTPAITAAAFDSHPTDKVVVIGQMTRPEAPTHWTAWLALTWMAGALVMLLRAGVKVAGAEKLRRSCQPLADEHIALIVTEACRAVGLARKIRVAVTDKLTSPAVVGVIVPTLILPLSLFTTLTPTQIQFVLLHELAHIRRGDCLANLFQLFAEALLFFNPAVWWISHQIRREREACCDALAIELSGAPADYARTLVRVAENILQPATTAALAFGDDGREPSPLADRVQRVLVPGYRPALRLTWRAMLSSLLIGSALLAFLAIGTRRTVGAILTSNPSPAKTNALLPTSNLTHSAEQDLGVLPHLAEFSTSEPASKTNSDVAIQVLGGSSYPSIEANGEILIATNGAIVKFADQELTADFIQINQTTGEVTARRNVHLETTNAVFTSQSLVWNTKSNQLSGIYDKVHFKSPFLMQSLHLGGVSMADTNEVYFASKLQPSTSILTEPQFRGVLKAIEQRDSVNLLTENPITIASNREAQIRATLLNLNNPSIHSPQVTNAPPNNTPAEPLVTRAFVLDVNGFYTAVRKAAGLAETVSLTNLGTAFPTFLAQAGVNFDRHLGKSYFFSHTRGDLVIRATENDMETIERLLKPLAGIPLTLGNFQITPQTLASAQRSFSPEINSILATNLAAGFRALLESFDPTDPRPKRVQYNSASGELLARATEVDLQKFADALNISRVTNSVLAGSETAPATNLVTRTFQVEPVSIEQGFRQMGVELAFSTTTNYPSAEMRTFLEKMGVGLAPPKSIYYNHYSGALSVRATQSDLDTIEQVLRVLNIARQPPQVNLKVRWVEIPPALANDLLLQTPTNGLPLPIFRVRDSSTILSEQQMTRILERINSRSGLELMSEGQVTTLSERQAQIQVSEMKTIVTGINPKALTPPGMTATNKNSAEYIEATPIPFGPVLDLLPKVSPDQTTISLQVIPKITVFLGYEEDAPEVPIYINGKKGKATLPLPKYRTQQMTNDCVLSDGQTLILGHLTTTEVAKKPDGTFQTTDVTSTRTNNLYIFVTATIIDPAGNRMNPAK